MKAIARIWGASLMLLAGVCTANDITGTFVPTYPEGWKDHGGACIGLDNRCDYSIGVLEKDKQLILYFGKSAPRSDPKKARWLITDQMPYPKAPAGFQVVYGDCERDGRPDKTIIAVVKTTDTEWYTTVHFAYRANLNTGRFEKTPINGIRCINIGWGL